MYGDNYGYRCGPQRLDGASTCGQGRGAASATQPLRARRHRARHRQQRRHDAVTATPTTVTAHRHRPDREEVPPATTRRASTVVDDFFSARASFDGVGLTRRRSIVTSIAMFYDLPDAASTSPRTWRSLLADDGVWHFEQSLPARHARPATLRHRLPRAPRVLRADAARAGSRERAGLRVLDVSFNDVNGGSFAVTAEQGESGAPAAVTALLEDEKSARAVHASRPTSTSPSACSGAPRRAARRDRQAAHRGQEDLSGYGASTKGNVTAPVLRARAGRARLHRRGQPRQVRLRHARAPRSRSSPRPRRARASPTTSWCCPGTFARASSRARAHF